MGRWKNRPDGSNWGDFGPDDQIGRLNLLTPAKVLEGVAEVREGRSFCLSLPLDLPGGNLLNNARHAPQRFATRTPDGTDRYLLRLADTNADFYDVVNDDRVILHTQYSTQWDALAHVGAEFDADGDGVAEKVFYNGWRGGEHIAPGARCDECGDMTGVEATRLGVETIAETCVQGRAVMIDLHAAYGDAHLDVDFTGLSEVMAAQNVTVEAGDMVCFHTGFGRKIMEMAGAPDKAVLHGSCTALEGRDPVLQEWIRDSGVVALIADNYAVERVPSRTGSGKRPFLPLHQLCLFKLGVPLAELWWLTDLADYLRAAGRTRFLLTAPPLRLPGAVGSPVTPVATV
jgi:kynurenine formamidase